MTPCTLRSSSRPGLLALALSALSALACSTVRPALAAVPASAPLRVQDKGGKDRHPKFEFLNLSKKGLALEGYDPVAYFPEFGGKPTEGDANIAVTYRGVTYRFASEKNRQAFLAKPERFEPTYGGWCAWALAKGKGDFVDPSPESFTIESDKLFLFYDGFFNDTREKWKEGGGAPKLEARADANWERLTKPKPKG